VNRRRVPASNAVVRPALSTSSLPILVWNLFVYEACRTDYLVVGILAGATLVMDDERVHSFWLNSDRDGYVQEAQKSRRWASGGPVPRPVASRWFNLNTILVTTAEELWIHPEDLEPFFMLSGAGSAGCYQLHEGYCSPTVTLSGRID
jgi:hypothetical protein